LQVKFGQWLSLICVVIILIILWQIRQMLLLLFTAIVLATAMNSVVQRLRKLGIRRGRAVPLTIGLTIVLIGLVIYLIVPPFISQFLELLALLPRGVVRVVDWLEFWLNRRPAWLSQVELPNASVLTNQLQPLIRLVVPNFLALFTNSLSTLVQLFLLAVLTLMLLADPGSYRRAFIQVLPRFYRPRADQVLLECESALESWMGAAVISSTVVALLSAIGLWALQIPFVLAQALLAGLLNFIPNIGPTLSMVFPLTVAALDAPWKVLAVAILYLVIQNLESYWITPTIMANQVSLLPALTLAAQIFFASSFGFMGLLLALPLAVVAKVLIQEILVTDILDKWGRPSPVVAAAPEPDPIVPPVPEPIPLLPAGETSNLEDDRAADPEN
jgi:predicted PurR-regulated permease PerM